MLDDTLKYSDERPEFRSPFDLELDPVEVETIKWFVLGHLVYISALTLAMFLRLPDANIWLIPLFTIPLLVADRDQRSWARILVFVIGFTAIHYLAVQLAANAYDGGPSLVPGAIGGAVGAAGSLGLLAVFGLLRGGSGTVVFSIFSVLLLALAGSFGVQMYLASIGDDGSFAGRVIRMLWIYTPWQVFFAFVLTKVLKPA
jgi:hypothetical protein